jgi:hypothetical protein
VSLQAGPHGDRFLLPKYAPPAAFSEYDVEWADPIDFRATSDTTAAPSPKRSVVRMADSQ